MTREECNLTRKVHPHRQNALMVAIAREKRHQKKPRLEGVSTLKKPTKPERFIIASSFTWKDEQLDRHRVTQSGVSGPKSFIPRNGLILGTVSVIDHVQNVSFKQGNQRMAVTRFR